MSIFSNMCKQCFYIIVVFYENNDNQRFHYNIIKQQFFLGFLTMNNYLISFSFLVYFLQIYISYFLIIFVYILPGLIVPVIEVVKRRHTPTYHHHQLVRSDYIANLRATFDETIQQRRSGKQLGNEACTGKTQLTYCKI